MTAGADSDGQTVISAGLLGAARTRPDADFHVIVQGRLGSGALAADVEAVASEQAVEHEFETVSAVAAELTGTELLALAEGADPIVITPDSAVAAAETADEPPEVAEEPPDTVEDPPDTVEESTDTVEESTDTVEEPAEPVEEPADTVEETEPPAGDQPTVTGDPEPGVELAATPGALGEFESLVYQWQRCEDGSDTGCTDIDGAVDATYTPVPDDRGLRLRVVVTASAAGQSAASALTEPITAKAPTAVSPPSILGTSEAGQTLQAANGSWAGTMLLRYRHQWQRCDASAEGCVDVDGATDASYTLTNDDVGATLRLLVAVRGLAGEGYAVTDATPAVTAIPTPLPRFKQQWPYVAGVASLLTELEGQEVEPPTIAIVDSGIDAERADFGGRVIERVALTSHGENQPGDGNGHGTAVASLAAGDGLGYTGAAPNAKLVDVDVLDDEGAANVSDVIKAADWIYENRERLNIRVANFSLHGTSVASVASDPLDKAVERLWLSGVVVVTAAGNYAVDGQESAIPFAPANDPFVLTVGATDTRSSYTVRDDVPAPWSAWGYTRDGFAKPEVGAPGRYIAAAVSAAAKLARDRPERITEPGYMQLSGTSLSAPVVAGTAAMLLAVHPEWRPDEVKGALMLSAEPLPSAPFGAVGVGAVNAASAAAVVDPPNPNLALNGFLVPDPAGGPTPVFDAATWTAAAESDVAWGSVAWGSVAWGSAAWSSVAWGSVAWGSVAWGSVAWGSVAWGSVAWGSHADDDVRQEGPYWAPMN